MAEFLWRVLAWVLSRPRVARWLAIRAHRTPYAPITKNGSLYMDRWWLFNPYEPGTYVPKYTWCPISIRLHHIMRPDADGHLHDHPWNARTIILHGGYIEEREGNNLHSRKPGSTVALRFGEYHRIVQVDPALGALTLFITGKYRGTWGFKVDGAKVPYREYLS